MRLAALCPRGKRLQRDAEFSVQRHMLLAASAAAAAWPRIEVQRAVLRRYIDDTNTLREQVVLLVLRAIRGDAFINSVAGSVPIAYKLRSPCSKGMQRQTGPGRGNRHCPAFGREKVELTVASVGRYQEGEEGGVFSDGQNLSVHSAQPSAKKVKPKMRISLRWV